METLSINSEIQLILEQQEIIFRTMAQLFPSRIVSTTDSQLEYELANLVYGNPESDYAEASLLPPSTLKTDGVK